MGGKDDYLRARHAFGVMLQHDIPGVGSKGEQITVNEHEVIPASSVLFKQLGAAAIEEHFEPVTSFGRWDVEQATAAPGEKRGQSRGVRKAAASGEKRGAK